MKISLEQWRAFVAVVEHGGFTQAAEALHKSQSAISYAVRRVEDAVGARLFKVHGRRAILTAFGAVVLRRARHLISEAARLEEFASRPSRGFVSAVSLAMETICPLDEILICLDRFSNDPQATTMVQIVETVMGGSAEALAERRVDLAITPHVPTGVSSTFLQWVSFVLVVGKAHPLANAEAVSLEELQMYRHIVTRDSGRSTNAPPLTIQSDNRWTFGHMSAAKQAVLSGYGYAWLPLPLVAGHIKSGTLVCLNSTIPKELQVPLYLAIPDRDHASDAVLALATHIEAQFKNEHRYGSGV